MLLILRATATPKPAIATPTKKARMSVGITPETFRFATIKLNATIINPWIIATIAPPVILPRMLSTLLAGATRISFMKPNCLSHIIVNPCKKLISNTVITTTPGTR
ncbi:105aa long hypothetical protein [Pyrococcus horikoshii OT3]|uniref:Uncharacterized protein n=1 Tax=Pyrococcus horikoshii (strain ATCC 700860 / DSM 12428 / JCM 9974 / NBRC 100139 / OT-3) TaxID=70601 RepID=O58622_PYRHO|nr:105aa long hypothetical protein [Pyrococcus horikoshii OT3]